MSKIFAAICAAIIAAPLVGFATDAAAQGAQSGGAQASSPARGGGGGGGFRAGGGGGFRAGGGGGFRAGGGGFRGGFGGRDNFRFRGGFYGGFGPGFGFYDPWYDPFWGPRYGFGYGFYGSYPYGYYSPPARVIVRDRIPEPGYLPAPDAPPPAQNWYRCDNPQGFYPYVQNCNGPWQSVPVTPPNGSGPPPR